MVFSDRSETLESAKFFALSQNFKDAIHLVNLVLQNNPNDVQALCLKGNILEMQGGCDYLNSIERVGQSAWAIEARCCYIKALEIDSANTWALRDLADNLKNSGDYEGALRLYDELIFLLEKLPPGMSEGELEDAIDERLDLLKMINQ